MRQHIGENPGKFSLSAGSPAWARKLADFERQEAKDLIVPLAEGREKPPKSPSGEFGEYLPNDFAKQGQGGK
jgi:hypothetical protein